MKNFKFSIIIIFILTILTFVGCEQPGNLNIGLSKLPMPSFSLASLNHPDISLHNQQKMVEQVSAVEKTLHQQSSYSDSEVKDIVIRALQKTIKNYGVKTVTSDHVYYKFTFDYDGATYLLHMYTAQGPVQKYDDQCCPPSISTCICHGDYTNGKILPPTKTYNAKPVNEKSKDFQVGIEETTSNYMQVIACMVKAKGQLQGGEYVWHAGKITWYVKASTDQVALSGTI